MIDGADQQLKAWIATLLPGVEVSLLPPIKFGDEQRIGLYLIDMQPLSPTSSERRPPLQVQLRYLVTCWADDPEQAHHMLGQLVFAAMEHPEFDVDFEPVSAHLWAAFAEPPRPCFMLRLPLRVERKGPPVKLVRTPLELQISPFTTLQGQVVGPEDTPIANATVELQNHNLAARTDYKGCFTFSTVPLKPDVKRVRILARNREFSTEIAHKGDAKEPVVIHFDAMEV